MYGTNSWNYLLRAAYRGLLLKKRVNHHAGSSHNAQEGWTWLREVSVWSIHPAGSRAPCNRVAFVRYWFRTLLA